MRPGVYRRWGKRLLDVCASAAGLLALGPLLALVALALKALDPGPVFFVQTRAGLRFKPFRIYKFRSMRQGGRGLKITSDGDARITPLGRFLRKSKVDELPQLFNVLRGDMSLVGPRPTVPKYAEMYRAEYEAILSVKPGITDYGSLRYRDEESVLGAYDAPEEGYMDDVLPEKMALYRRYIAEMSLWVDLRILVATVLKVVRVPGLAPAERGRPVVIRPLAPRDRRAAVVLLDLALVLAAYALAFVLHFDFSLAPVEARGLVLTAPYGLFSYLLTSHLFGVNRGLRYYASFGDVLDTVKAAGAAAALQAAVVAAAPGVVPGTVLLLWPLLCVVCVCGLHASLRGVSHHLRVRVRGGGRRRVVVIAGVGDLGELAYQSMRSDESVDYRVAAFFDEDGGGFGVRLHGAPVVSGSALSALLRRAPVDEVVVSVERERRARTLSALADALNGAASRPAVRVMPAIDELTKAPRRPEPRKVRPADLLDRCVVPLDREAIGRALGGKSVLITGAGGMIGGELARQALLHGPRKLVLLESQATALFQREAELRDLAGAVEVVAALGDVRDLSLLDRVFHDERPEVVFHAAAHKHPHQLETNIHEGVSNNLIATYHLAASADRCGVERFVLLSTDKAARPASLMAATKRAAETVVTTLARGGKTRFCAVRFGSVLGSSDSVLRVFQEQIEKGRPLTLAHADAARYFMTAEEAVGLVLQAAVLAEGGEVFTLKPGEQIRVMDLARRLVRLSGLDPERDVSIRVLGSRPGEPAEDAGPAEAGPQGTCGHPALTVQRPEEHCVEGLPGRILHLEVLSYTAGKEAMVRALSSFVPGYEGPRDLRDFRVRPDSLDPSSN